MSKILIAISLFLIASVTVIADVELETVEFIELHTGSTATNDLACVDETNYKRFELLEERGLGAIEREPIYKSREKKYRIKTALTVLGGIKNIVGLGMYLSGVKEFKKWGAGLMVLGTVEISIGISI